MERDTGPRPEDEWRTPWREPAPDTGRGPDPLGPPPPPLGAAPPPSQPQPAPRRGGRVLLVLAVLIGTPLGVLGLAELLGGRGDDEPAGVEADAVEPAPDAVDPAPDAVDPDDDAVEPAPDAGGSDDDAGIGRDELLEPLDLGALDGVDALYARLLTDIDASEVTMLAFQADLLAAFEGPLTGPALIERLSQVAEQRRQELLEVRERLQAPLDDPGAERVRGIYVDHLDAWAVYMSAVEQDPRLLAEPSDGGYTVAINASADAFSRALEQELPADADAEVARFADELLDRGFRGFGQAQV